MRSLPLLEHTATGQFTIQDFDARRFYEVVRKSDGTRVTLPNTNGVITMPSNAYGEFYLYFSSAEGNAPRTRQEFWRKAWSYRTYQYGQCCSNINPCDCCTGSCGGSCPNPGDWGNTSCYNCCGQQCGPCTGYAANTEPAPWEYGPGTNNYPYSGGEWFYIKEVEKL